MFFSFLEQSTRRPDITEGLKRLKCRTLIFVGENSPFHSEAIHMTSKLDRRYSALVEDRIMKELHSTGKTTDEIPECLKCAPIHPWIVAAIKSAYALGITTIIYEITKLPFIDASLFLDNQQNLASPHLRF